MSILTIILGLIIAGIVYALREQLIAAAVFIGALMGVGALVFWLLFDKPGLGANVGFCLAIFIGLRYIIEHIWWKYRNTLEYIYRIISAPIWFLNRLQLILTGPWRYYFKYFSVGNSSRDVLRPLFFVIQILLYIITTPLRLLNALLYNILIYGLLELYDLSLEVFIPNNYDEGRGSFWKWIVWFPIRIIKYPLFHGSLVLIEGCIWTIIDIFIPTITMYHGTNLNAAKSILGSSNRNKSLWNNWLAGTFKASNSANGWGGLGVYFTPARWVASNYSVRAGGTPVFITCRVSLGKILNYALAPIYVEANVGGRGQHSVLNTFAEKNNYTTAEWWNGSYWEYCMFDWQNRYNHPWRIRPVYVFNLETGLPQHIDGGFRHWFFSEAIIDDILKSKWFTAIVAFSIFLFFFLFFMLYNSISRLNLSDITPKWSKPNKEYVVEKPQTVDYFVEEPVTAEEPKSPEPVKETPKPVYNPPAKKYSNSGSYSSSKKSKSNRQKSTYKSSPPPNNRPKSKYGFRLEKVDRIPTKDNPSNKKNGFHLEKVDRIPTKDNPSNKKDVDDVYYY